MTAPFGVTADGLSVPTFEEKRDAAFARLTGSFGVVPSDKTIEGIVVSIVTAQLIEAWEALEIVYGATNRDGVGGALLENLGLLIGTLKRPAEASTVTLTLTGEPGTTVDAGSIVKSGSLGSTLDPDSGDALRTTIFFSTDEDATLSGVDAWASSTAYSVGRVVTNGSRVYRATVAGTSAGSGGPTGTGGATVDGTVTWDYLGDGTATATVDATCTVTGPIAVGPGGLEVITTPIGGWLGVTNVAAADVGRNADTDQDLRLRIDADLARLGSSPLPALRSELLQVEGVDSVTIFMNVGDTPLTLVDDGPTVTLPPHSVEALIVGGDDQDIRDALLAGVAAGIRTYGFPGGNVTGTAVDGEGNTWTIEFARPAAVPIYVDVVLTHDESYPADGDAQVKAAVVAYGEAQAPGRDAVASAISAAIFRAVPGILDATVLVDTTALPAETAVALGRHQLAAYDAVRVTVASSEDDA